MPPLLTRCLLFVGLQVPHKDDDEVASADDCVRLTGYVASRLFVYKEDTLEFVENLIRQDLTKTIQQRIYRATYSTVEPTDDSDEELIGNGLDCISV